GAERAALPVATVMREDATLLVGCASWEERHTFLQLVAVPGLGPKTALAMLGVFDPAGLAAAVAREDVTALTRVPGIGPKTARRLLVDLKGRVRLPAAAAAVPDASSAFADSVAALVSLGYGEDEAAAAVRAVLAADPEADVSQTVRQALRRFVKPA
ncbi:MAG: Holliday junction branch migration protein RuvA, partial [Desulfomicrobiaceae bacterium]